MHSKYFQGILQLRNASQEVLDYLQKWLDSRKQREVNDVKEVTNGADFYFISNKTLAAIGKRLYEHFGGDYKSTSTLHTRDSQKSRDLYRLTVMVRFFDFCKGSYVVWEDKVYKVIGLSKSVITAKNITTGKVKKINAVKGDVKTVEESFEVVVSKTYPNLEVLDPETYQSVRVENPRSIKKTEVEVIKVNEKIYLIS